MVLSAVTSYLTRLMSRDSVSFEMMLSRDDETFSSPLISAMSSLEAIM